MRRTVAIVGTNWGRIHIGTLRRLGCEVVTLIGLDFDRTRRIADEEGVAGAATDLAACEGVDVVVVASPIDTHASIIERFAGRFILCEKPMFGDSRRPRVEVVRSMSTRLWINYAFAFVPGFDALRDVSPHELSITARVGLGPDMTLDRALQDVAIHPLAAASSLMGPLSATTRLTRDADALRLSFVTPAGFVGLELQLSDEPGIHYGLRARGNGASASLAADYRPGQAWRYAVDDQVVAIEGPQDPWYLANCRAVANAVAVMTGERTRAEAIAAGGIDGTAAQALECAVFGTRL